MNWNQELPQEQQARDDRNLTIFRFPDNFLWGVATSHFQVEGHPVEIDQRLSDWAQWTQMQGKILDQTSADQACNFFNQYKADIELVRKLNLNCFRLSLNWPAMCPGPGTQYRSDDPTLLYYKEMLRMLKEQGLKTFVTLFHFCLPSWLADIGGWNNERTVDEFERFTKFVAEELGEHVDFWMTINEPLAYVYQGYVSGSWPPGFEHNYLGGFECVRNMLHAHAKAYHAIHNVVPNAQVSITHHWMSFSPRNKFSPMDHIVKYMRDQVFNHCFLNALHTGKLEFPWPTRFDHRLNFLSGEIPGLKGTMDFLGINYYTRQFCEFQLKFPLDFFGAKSEIEGLETSGLGWENYPQGLYDLLVHELKPYRLDKNGKVRDIYITENGHANLFEADLNDDGDWSLEDTERVAYLNSHLMATYKAIMRGANVKGYLHWSLLDNFEWAEGLRARFGLVRVSYPTLKRTPRRSAMVYAEIAHHNGIPVSKDRQ